MSAQLRKRLHELEKQVQDQQPLEEEEIMDLASAIRGCKDSEAASILKIIKDCPSWRRAIDWDTDDIDLTLMDPATLHRLQEFVGKKQLLMHREKRVKAQEKKRKAREYNKMYRAKKRLQKQQHQQEEDN